MPNASPGPDRVQSSSQKCHISRAHPAIPRKAKVDKDLERIVALETATQSTAQHYLSLGMSLLFLLITLVVAIVLTRGVENSLFVVVASVVGGHMALNIGANDVANAVSSLAAVVSVLGSGHVDSEVTVPLWVMAVGATGISAGLVPSGPRVIRIVGERITRLDPIRAFCIALSAAVTVIAASEIGLPVSSTQIAVGGVFGVGFLREAVENRKRRRAMEAAANGAGESAGETTDEVTLTDEVLARKLENAGRRRLVRRVHLLNIAAAWIVTVPAPSLLAAGIFLLLKWLAPF